MSDIGGARIRLDGDASGVVNAANQSNAALKSLETNVAQNWWGLRNLSLAFAALPAAASAGLGLAVKSAVEFETAMAGVERTTYDASLTTQQNAAALGVLTDQLLAVARVTPISTTGILGIAEAAGALGVAQGDVAGFTKVVGDLSATTNLTQERAATDLARIAALTGVSAAGYDNLASSIFEAGRTTAATETEITSAATRIARIAGVIGLTADQVIGLAAAIRSAGLESQAGSTSVVKTFTIMKSAVDSLDTKKLGEFGQLTKQTGAEFAASFKADPSGTFAKFIQGLGEANRAGKDTTTILKDLHLNDIRVSQALNALGQAQTNTTNDTVKLTTILGVANKAFLDSAGFTASAEKRYATFQSQVQILKNQFFEFGVIIGSSILPVLKFFVNIISDVVSGLRAMPAPFRNVAVGVALLTAGLSGIVSVALLFGARLALAIGSLTRLFVVAEASGGGLRGLASQFTSVSATANQAASSVLRANTAIAATGTASAKGNAAAAASKAAFIPTVVGPLAAPVLTSRGNVNPIATATRQNALNRANPDLLDPVVNKNGTLNAGATAARERAAALAAEKAAAQTAASAAVVEGEAVASAGAATTVAAAASSKMGAALGFLGKAAGIVGIALTAFTIVTAIYGDATKKAEEKQAKLFGKQDDLVKALGEQARGLNKNADAWVANGVAQANAKHVAEGLGISVDTLNNIVKGDTSSAESTFAIRAIQEAVKKGVPGAKQLGDQIVILAKQYHASADEAGVVKTANGDLAASAEDAAAADQAATDASNERTATLEAQAKASVAFIDAQQSEKDAIFSMDAAKETLRKAREDVAKRAQDEAKASEAVSRANRDEKKAQRDLIDAKKALDRARADGIREQTDAESSLQDARDKYADSLLNITEKEKALAKLRAGPSVKDLVAATKKLEDAQKKLRDSTDLVSDAQFNLNYLIEEGASGRDIKDAQNTLADAQSAAKDDTQNLTDAQIELNKVRAGPTADELAKAEREVQGAYRDSKTDLENISKGERDLADIRQKNASDTYYTDALDRYQTAQDAIKDAVYRVADAEIALAELRRKNASVDLAKAENDYQNALIKTAKAMAETRKQQRILNGETVSTATEAHDLADALTDVALASGDAEATKSLLGMAAALSKVKDASTAPLTKTPPPAKPNVDPTKALTDALPPPKPQADLGDALGRNKGKIGGLAGALLGGKAGAAAGAAIGTSIGPEGTAIGAVIGGTIGAVGGAIFGEKFANAINWEKLKKDLEDNVANFGIGETIVGALTLGMSTAFQVFTGFDLFKWCDENILQPIKDFFGIASPSKVMIEQGGYIIEGLAVGLLDGLVGIPGRMFDGLVGILTGAFDTLTTNAPILLQFFIDLPGKVVDALVDWNKKLSDKASQVWKDFRKFFDDHIDDVLNFFRDLPQKIVDAIGDIFTFMKRVGKDIINGIREGIHESFPDFSISVGGIYTAVTSFFSGAIDWLKNAGYNIMVGLSNGILSGLGILKDVWNSIIDYLPGTFADGLKIKSPSRLFQGYGQSIMQGLSLGIEDEKDSVLKTMADFSKTLAGTPSQYAFTALSPLVGLDGQSGSTASAQPAVVNNDNRVVNNNLSAVNAPSPSQIVDEFMWANQISTRD